jgi:hypothetical protein
MNTHESLTAVAREAGWIVFDADGGTDGRTSQTYGIQNIACLQVRFGLHGRVVNAIYVHFPSTHRDQFIYQRQKGKRELVEHILRTVPEKIPSWFADTGQPCGGHRCDGSASLCFDCEAAIYDRELERLRALLRDYQSDPVPVA